MHLRMMKTRYIHYKIYIIGTVVETKINYIIGTVVYRLYIMLMHMAENTTTQYVTSSSKSKVTTSISKPKIIVVEDKKTNITIIQSMK